MHRRERTPGPASKRPANDTTALARATRRRLGFANLEAKPWVGELWIDEG